MFHRDWPLPPDPITPLTPIDRSKQREEEEEEEGKETDGGRKRRRNDPSQGDDGRFPMAQAVSMNGRRVLLCNFNNVVFQVQLVH